MSLHDINKQRNRDRILDAADEIIRRDGMEALNMRHLAEYAGVSLRTPYNLFGSKTAILGELLIRTLGQRVVPPTVGAGQSGIGLLLGLLDALAAARPALDEHVRLLFWSIMTGPEAGLRAAGTQQITALVTPLVETAHRQGELAPDANPQALARQLVVIFLAVFGMWAGNQLDIDESVQQVEQAWLAALLCHAAEQERAVLRARLGR